MGEEREEKRREIKKETKDDHHHRSQPDHIPLDLTLEILSRLPVKSIVRFSCVSKLWSSFITLPCFINLFASRSSLRQPSLLLTVSLQQKPVCFLFPQNQNPDGSYSPPVYSCQFTNPKEWEYQRCSNSIHGLILLQRFKIWNPSLRRVFVLPHPNEHISSRRYWSYLMYDILEGKHKVLYINENSLQPQILTLGAQESWRIITKSIPMHCPYHSPGRYRCFNGVLYYRAKIDDQPIIMSFDVKSENFNPIKYPKGVFKSYHHMMIPYEGRLTLATTRFPPDGGVVLRILKDDHGHEWTHQRFLLAPKSGSTNCITAVTNAGELIFATRSFLESFYVQYFDPRRNITREALFEGIDDEIRRHGLDSGYMHTLNIFPDHMESLFSL